MNLKIELEDRMKLIETCIQQYLPKEEGFQQTILEAMNYSLLAGGKRIRPLFMLECYRLFGGEEESLIRPFMAAIEMIHTYSLIHDDLPALDNDDFRRGKKTTHIVYGEAMAILAGDGLLNYAYETACNAFQRTRDICVVAKALTVLAKKPGIYGMIGGQVVDVEAGEGKIEVKEETLDFIYKLKTGALIEASMMIGAILAGASEKEVSFMEQIGNDIGIAFQIQDDILDITSSVEVLGKPICSDEKNRKTTYVTLKGLERAKEEVIFHSERAIQTLERLDRTNEFLNSFMRTLITRKK